MSYLSEKGWGPVSDMLHNTTRGKCSHVSIYTHSNRLQLGRSFRLSLGCAWLSTTGCAGCAGLSTIGCARLSADCAWLSTTGCAGCAGLSTTGCAGYSPAAPCCPQQVVPGCPQRVVPVVRLRLSDLHMLVYRRRGPT